MDISSVNTLTSQLSAPAEAASPQPAGPEQRELIQAVKAVNAAELFGNDRELAFVVDRDTRRVVVRIVDRVSREVVRQIPAATVLQMAEESSRG